MGLGGQRHAPTASPPRKTRYPLYRRLGRPQSRSGHVRKIAPPPGLDPRTVQSVASPCTDYTIPAPKQNRTKKQKQKWNWCPHTQTHAADNTRTFCQMCFVLSTVSGQLQWSEYIIMALQGKWRWSGHVHGCGRPYIPRIKNNKRKNKRRLWVSPRLSKRKMNLQVCSLPEVLNPCPQHIRKGPNCAETSLQAVTLVTQKKPSVFIDRRWD